MYEEMIRPLVEPMVKQVNESLKAHGIGKDMLFDPSGFHEVTLAKEVEEKLIYPNVKVMANEKEYYFILDGHSLYRGLVDTEGIDATVNNDILSTPDFINVMTAIANEDTDKVIELFQSPSQLLLFMEQLGQGYEKGKENGHYE